MFLLQFFGIRQSMGARGEREAGRFLRRAGYRILARNLRRKLGEIDILALAPDGKTVVVVEVKSGRVGGIRPEVHVNRQKQRKLAALAGNLVQRYRLADRLIRFDVVAVEFPHAGKPTIRHHIAAFESHV